MHSLFVIGALLAAMQADAPLAATEVTPTEVLEIEAALRFDASQQVALPDPPHAATPVPASMNPDISLILDTALAGFTADDPLQSGGHDPAENGFTLQQLEHAFGHAVDPYFRLDGNIIFSLFGLEIEEVYATTLALPYSLQVRFGQLLTRFGRFNNTHLHAWKFVDQPIVIGKFFGSEGNRGLGAEVSYLSPLPWYAELVFATADARGAATARSFLNEGGEVSSPLDLQHTLALKQFFPISND